LKICIVYCVFVLPGTQAFSRCYGNNGDKGWL